MGNLKKEMGVGERNGQCSLVRPRSEALVRFPVQSENTYTQYAQF